jgi:hypothetical protein
VSPRFMLPSPPPSEELLLLLQQEREDEKRLRHTRVALLAELEKLTKARGLTVRLSVDDIRQELKMREQADGNG